uniref:Saposin B-type domain-containing protein n=1 Tax=Coptotermes formosanus TaxID=36987 RepID=R4UVI5_COPFO|nr:hypothetical protein [Coptotermes formosanus]
MFGLILILVLSEAEHAKENSTQVSSEDSQHHSLWERLKSMNFFQKHHHQHNATHYGQYIPRKFDRDLFHLHNRFEPRKDFLSSGFHFRRMFQLNFPRQLRTFATCEICIQLHSAIQARKENGSKTIQNDILQTFSHLHPKIYNVYSLLITEYFDDLVKSETTGNSTCTALQFCSGHFRLPSNFFKFPVEINTSVCPKTALKEAQCEVCKIAVQFVNEYKFRHSSLKKKKKETEEASNLTLQEMCKKSPLLRNQCDYIDEKANITTGKIHSFFKNDDSLTQICTQYSKC